MTVRDGDPVSAQLLDPTQMSTAMSKGWNRMQKIRRRRLQLAAALIEADNLDIDKRITFLIQNDPRATDLLAHLTKLLRYANDSVIFRDTFSKSQEYERPVYTYRPSTQRELSRGYLHLQQDCELEDMSQPLDDQAQPTNDTEVSDTGKNKYEQISFSLDDFGSPVLNVLDQAPSIEVAAQAHAEQEQKKNLYHSKESESRSKRLLDRIHNLNTVVHSSPAPDISFSSTEDMSISQDKSYESHARDIPSVLEEGNAGSKELEYECSSCAEESMEGLGILNHQPRSDLQSFRERVMKSKPQKGLSDISEQRATETPSSFNDAETLLEHPFNNDTQKTLQGSEISTKQLNAMAKGYSHLRSSHILGIPPHTHNVDESLVKPSFKPTSSIFTKKENLSRLLIPAVSRRKHERNYTPILDGLSPIPDSYDPTLQNISNNIISTEGEMLGVSLQSPSMPQLHTNTASMNEPPITTATDKPPRIHPVSVAEPNSSYITYEDDPTPANQSLLSERDIPVRRRQSWAPSYICVPAPLQDLQVQTTGDTFYVPQGAFKLDHGIILPTLSCKGDSYGPIQVPLGMGRRVLYPSTALFRNVLVTRDHEQEGWGWDRYTSSAKYFEGAHADDDDSDDDLPLMDVRIHRRENHIIEKRITREKKRQRRARAERQRLRALAREKGKAASVYGVTEESSEGELSDASSDYDISSDETDPELPWVDDLRPAGKLYGKSLMCAVEAEKMQRDSKIRFYGQVSKNDVDGQHPFQNDTRERMRRIFGDQSRFQEEMEGHAEQETFRLKDLVDSLDRDTPDQTEQLTPEELRAQEVIKEHDMDEHVADAWKGESSDDDAASVDLAKTYKPRRRPRASNWPRWMDKSEDDVPLSELHFNSAPASDDDNLPLASQHPHAEIIAEKEAIIRRLEEENKHVRMMLQLRTSMPPMPLQPWMMPINGMVPQPNASMEPHVFDEPSSFLQPLPHKPNGLAEPPVMTHENQQGVLGWLSERETPDS